MRDTEQLRIISARLGRDLMMIQAAGGNTSVKVGRELWIKASGKWLSAADKDEIFLPIDIARVRRAITSHDADPGALTPVDGNPLRGSIETYFHALLPHKVVVHVHSVHAIAWGARTDAECRLSGILQGMDWRWVPYARPGLDLTRMMVSISAPTARVWVLGNHGLIIAGDTFEEVDSLLASVDQLMFLPVRRRLTPDIARLTQLCGSRWKLPKHEVVHQAALHFDLAALAASGTMYPDNAVFLGPACALLRPDSSMDSTVGAFREQRGMEPKVVLVEGVGTLVSSTLDAGGEDMAACLSLVLERVEDPLAIRLLTTSEVSALLNWNAEQYRQQMAKQPSAC